MPRSETTVMLVTVATGRDQQPGLRGVVGTLTAMVLFVPPFAHLTEVAEIGATVPAGVRRAR
jgi:hypothetical protein